MMVEGLGAGLASSSYASQDDAMLGAEETYSQMEAALQQKLDRFQQDHDYDEYRFDLDAIGHDPYVLISILSAMYPEGWILFRIVSSIVALLGVMVLVTYSPKNGIILLAIAFLVSPMGLPMFAVWILSALQGISHLFKSI